MDRKLSVLAVLLALSSLAASASAGIVGHWRFDEGTGTAVADSSGKGRNGVLEGAPKWTAPGWNNAGWCLQFGGNEDRVTVEPFDLTGTGITLAAWIKPSVFNNDARIISKTQDGATDQHYWAMLIGGSTGEENLQFRLRTNVGLASSYTAADTYDVVANEWTHIAVTWDAADPFMRQYKNGQQIRSDAKTGQTVATAPAIKIGIGNQSASVPDEANRVRPFGGLIDDVLVADRGLTANQIADLAKGLVPDFSKAADPNPADGAVGVESPLLRWTAGDNAVFHNVYLGTAPDLTEVNLVASLQPFAMYFHMQPLVPGMTYYWRVDEVQADMKTVHPGDVWSFTTLPATAHAAQPADGADLVPAEQLKLTWTSGINALSHDVYFGDDAAAVAAGTGNTFKGNQTTSIYSLGALQKGKTYYWRIDEVGMAGKVTGAVWSFTTIGAIAVVDPTLAAWWKLDEGSGTTVIDWSGHDHHGTLNGTPQWVEGLFGGALDFEWANAHECVVVPAFDVTTRGITLSAWIKPESFSRADARIIDKGTDVAAANDAWWMLSTVASGSNYFLRFRLKTDESATTTTQAATTGNIVIGEWCHTAAVWDGTSMILYKDAVEVARVAKGGNAVAAGTAARVYIGNQLGANAADSRRPWDGLIDDVRVYSKGLTVAELKEAMRGDTLPAWDPSPANATTTDAIRAGMLTWQAGEKAAKHEVYFGTERTTVRGADSSDTTGVYRGQLTKTSYVPDPPVEWGGEYFWRVDEINSDGTVTKGYLWSFKVADYLIVDDFEGYDDNVEAGTTIYDTWVDGWTNNTGSQVGNTTAPFAERTIVHGGKQSMPLHYDNAKSPYYSETERTFDVPEDWTLGGVQTLQLQVRGRALPGSASFDAATQVYTMTGAGANVWDRADQFHFAYKQLHGDGSITVRVESLSANPPHGDPRIGVMIRESLDPEAANALLFVEPDPRVRLTQRVRAADVTSDVAIAANVGKTPTWLRLTRSGFTFKAEKSDNGTAWTPLLATGSEASIFMTDPVYVGLVVCSHAAGNFIEAKFSNVKTTGQVSPAGPFTTSRDIGIASNSPQPMYVTLKDRTNRSATVTKADLVNTGVWTAWNIPLADFAGVNPAAVKTMILGVGDPKAPTADGAGLVYIDSIRVIK